MNMLPIDRLAAAPTSSPVLDRIFTAAPAPTAANDTGAASRALIVRRRERQRRRDAH